MRFVAVDWGTTRLRAYRVDGGTVLDRAGSEAGISRLGVGEHAGALARLCGPWLAAEPDLPIALAGMVGSREGWFPAPYVACPAGPEEVAAAAVPVDMGGGRSALVVPGLRFDGPDGPDVMRGEETHLVGSGLSDGLVCLPGTHCKWAEMREGRITRFATFLTGELHALLRERSMVGRPALEPADPAGFGRGLAAVASGGSLLHLLFGARAATVTGTLDPHALGPYLSGLLTGEEIAAALALLGRPGRVTVIAEAERAALYAEALARHEIRADPLRPEATFVAGIGSILAKRG